MELENSVTPCTEAEAMEIKQIGELYKGPNTNTEEFWQVVKTINPVLKNRPTSFLLGVWRELAQAPYSNSNPNLGLHLNSNSNLKPSLGPQSQSQSPPTQSFVNSVFNERAIASTQVQPSCESGSSGQLRNGTIGNGVKGPEEPLVCTEAEIEKFLRLQDGLLQLSAMHQTSEDELLVLFKQASCNFQKLVDSFHKPQDGLWTEIEDQMLLTLLGTKNFPDMQARAAFLGHVQG